MTKTRGFQKLTEERCTLSKKLTIIKFITSFLNTAQAYSCITVHTGTTKINPRAPGSSHTITKWVAVRKKRET